MDWNLWHIGDVLLSAVDPYTADSAVNGREKFLQWNFFSFVIFSITKEEFTFLLWNHQIYIFNPFHWSQWIRNAFACFARDSCLWLSRVFRCRLGSHRSVLSSFVGDGSTSSAGLQVCVSSSVAAASTSCSSVAAPAIIVAPLSLVLSDYRPSVRGELFWGNFPHSAQKWNLRELFSRAVISLQQTGSPQETDH